MTSERAEISLESKQFALKAARSIGEIQQHVSNLADVMVFLEVLGYTDEVARKNGFAGLLDLAKDIYEYLDMYETEANATEESTLRAMTKKRRLLEGLGMAFPVVAALILLMISGVSLWMARILPEVITTAFMSGVFLGILLTEGAIQVFGRLFLFYFGQGNLGETKRALRRNYIFSLFASCATAIMLLGIAYFGHIPTVLIGLTIASMLSIAFHRTSYMLIYSLRKIGHLVLAYACALLALVGIYSLGEGIIPDAPSRYFISLGAAFIILSIPAIYFHVKIIGMKSITMSRSGAPHFYSPPNVGYMTVKSRFGIQLWETIPFFIFGTFSFLMVFGDRIISWIFNPVVQSYPYALPLEFNSMYHVGADPALAVLMVTTLVTYVLMTPIYEQLTNLSLKTNVSQVRLVERYLARAYTKALAASLSTSASLALILYVEAPKLMLLLGASTISLEIFRIAAISDVFLSVFMTNAMFMNLVNKVNIAASISVVCAGIVLCGGVLLATSGFQNIIDAYFVSSVTAMISSTIYCKSLTGKLSRMFFARFI